MPTINCREKRTLSQLEKALFSELETSNRHPIIVNRKILECCNLIDSLKSSWLGRGYPYPVRVGPEGVGGEEYDTLSKYRKDIKQYLKLRQEYRQQTKVLEWIEIYARSILKRINGSLSDLNNDQHFAD